jgi:integrase
MPKARTRIGLREIRAMPPQSTIFDGGTGSVPGFGARRRAGPIVSYFIMYRTREDVESFMHKIAEGATKKREKSGKKRGVSHVRGGKGTASRTVGLLSAIFTYAQRKRMISDHPVRGVIRYADRRRQRRLSDDEYAALGVGLAALTNAPKPRKDGKQGHMMWPAAIHAARFLALTGWRSGEALTLRWGMLDLPRRTARLPDTKTGESVRPLASAACDLLRKLGPGKGDALVFPPSRGDGIMSGFPTLFERITKAGGLPKDVTPHILRHSFASLAADLGCSELAIAALLGHRSGSVTARYTHAADDVLLAVADRVGAATLRKMAGEGSAEVVAGPGVQQGVA